MRFDNRVTRMLGVEIPILQAPMGFIARPDLVAAVSNAGAMGLVPGSTGIDTCRAEIRRTRELTDKPFGVNFPLAFLRDDAIIDMVVAEGIRFVTTSAGSPDIYTKKLKDAGLTVFHVVPTLKAALKAVAAGVDGLVVEGSEGAGFKNPREVSSLVLVALVASQVSIPIVAAGGISDGRSMAAVFALGAEGVQMGTRMVATQEAHVHQNMKDAVVSAAETDTLMLGKAKGKAVRVLRTQMTSALEFDNEKNPMELLGDIAGLYERGDLEAALPQLGQVVGRIDEVLPAGEVIARTVREFETVVSGMARQYLAEPVGSR